MREFRIERARRRLARGLARGLTLGLIAVALVGCTRPSSVLVRTGEDPTYQDKDVAFRTTYYFRVFDYCVTKKRIKGEPFYVPMTDSLYRFRMTGKASTLLADIKFESGTLKAWEIDPFGANVIWDEDLRRFRFQSQQEADEEAKRKAALGEFGRLLATYKRIVTDEDLKGNGLVDDLKPKILQVLGRLLEDYAGAELGDTARTAKDVTLLESSVSKSNAKTTRTTKFRLDTGTQPGQTIDLTVIETTENDKTDTRIEIGGIQVARQVPDAGANIQSAPPRPSQILCEDNAPARRGFQVLGPEGWRTFDQDERLVMAMSSDAQPLISTLKDLSKRVLQSRSDDAAIALPLVEERLRLSQARGALAGIPPDTPPGDIAMRVAGILNAKEPDKPKDPGKEDVILELPIENKPQ